MKNIRCIRIVRVEKEALEVSAVVEPAQPFITGLQITSLTRICIETFLLTTHSPGEEAIVYRVCSFTRGLTVPFELFNQPTQW